MPTMARLVGAVLYAALAFYVSELIKPFFEEGFDPGYFSEVNTVVGLYIGWTVAGSRGGTGYVNAFSYGLTASVAMTVLGLFVHSFYDMIIRSMRKQYDGPVEAVVNIAELGLEHAQTMAQSEVLIPLIVGGILAGLLVEFVGQRTT